MAKVSFDRGLEILTRRTSLAKILLIAYFGVSAAALLVSIASAAGIVDLERIQLETHDIVAGIVWLVYIIVFVACVIVVSMWIYRAHSNLRTVGMGDPETSPGWAIGWFFIPFANLFKPYGAMESLAAQSAGTPVFASIPNTRLRWWWGCWIAGSILSNLGDRLGSSPDLPPLIGHLVDAAGTALLMGAALLLIDLMTTITRDQHVHLGVKETFA